MPDWEEFSEFLDDDEFAVSGVLLLADGSERPTIGLFDEPYFNTQTGEYDLDTTQPRWGCPAHDAVGVHYGDRIEIGGTVYDIVTEPQPDGTGWATLALAPQPNKHAGF